MSTQTYITIQPLDDSPPPTVELGGTGDDIPAIDFPETFPGARVSVQLGNHNDPAAWLRDFADALCHLADQVEQVQP